MELRSGEERSRDFQEKAKLPSVQLRILQSRLSLNLEGLEDLRNIRFKEKVLRGSLLRGKFCNKLRPLSSQ